MKKKVAVMVVLGMLLVVLQAWGEESKYTGMKIDVTKMTCKDLMSGNDTDRAVVVSYFHGFLAGKKNSTVVDVDATSALSDKIRDYCLSNPTITVMDAFAKSAK